MRQPRAQVSTALNAAPSQKLLVIRRNHRTGDVSLDPLRWGLIPYWRNDPTGGRKPNKAKCETAPDLPTFRDAYPLGTPPGGPLL
jgi:putative SOS response-associated peptidase YedK